MGSVDINVRKGENSKIFLFFFLTMFENYISKAIEKKTRLIWYLTKSLKTTIQPSSIKTFQHPIILTFEVKQRTINSSK